MFSALAPPAFSQDGAIPVRLFDKKAKESGLDAVRLKKIVSVLEDEIATGTLPNAGLYIYRNGRLGWWAELGYSDLEAKKPIDKNSLFRLFSMTKPMTAAAVMLLVDDGLLLLDDPVHQYLPEFKDIRVVVADEEGKIARLVPAAVPIRVRDLLTHTDGLSYNFMPTPLAEDYTNLGIEPGNPQPSGRKHPTLASMVSDLATLPLVHQPGYAWHYGVGLDVAGRLVEVVAGQEFASFMRERLLKPLDMKNTAFSVLPRVAKKHLTILYQRNPEDPDQLMAIDPPPGAENSGWAQLPAVVSGGGGLVGTASDYANFANMLLNLGSHKGKQVLSRRSVQMMMSDQMSPGYGTGKLVWPGIFDVDSRISGVGFGLGGAVYTDYGVSGRPYSPGSYTWGGAAGTTFWVDPAEQLTVVFMTQLLEVGSGSLDALEKRLTNLVYQGLSD